MARLGIEDLRIELAEELFVQPPDGFMKISARYDHPEVERRRALRDHTRVDATQRTERAGCNPRRGLNPVAHQAYHRLVAIFPDLGEFAHRGHDFREPL